MDNRTNILHSIAIAIIHTVPDRLESHGAELTRFYACNILRHCFFKYAPAADPVLDAAVRGIVHHMCSIQHPVPEWVYAVAQLLVAAITITKNTITVHSPGSDLRARLLRVPIYNGQPVPESAIGKIFSEVAAHCRQDIFVADRRAAMASMANGLPIAIVAAVAAIHAAPAYPVIPGLRTLVAPASTREARQLALQSVAAWAVQSAPVPPSLVKAAISAIIAARVYILPDDPCKAVMAAVEASTGISPVAYDPAIRDICYSVCVVRLAGMPTTARSFKTVRYPRVREIMRDVFVHLCTHPCPH
jgi:hypothetical protein